MNINTWQQLSGLKKDLYESLNILIADPGVEREVIASDLLNSVKKLNGIEEIYQRSMRKSEMILSMIAHKKENGIPLTEKELEKKNQINFVHLENIANIKAGLLHLVYVLLEDDLVEREVIAFDLSFQVNNLNELEMGCIQHLEKNEFPRIQRICEELEISREKEKASAN